jgi:hypothetical protein
MLSNPTCPQPHLWNQEESGINAIITASLPLALGMAKHQMGEMVPTVIMTNLPHLASPGKAINGRGSVRQHGKLLMEFPAKCQKSHPSFMAKPYSLFWPQDLLEVIKLIMNLISPCPEKPLFHFNFDGEGAEKNFLILKRSTLTLVEHSKPNFAAARTHFGIQKGNNLFLLLRYHPLWPRMEQLLFKGSNWPTTPIPKECRIANLDKAIMFGSHKGASSQPKLLQELVKGNVIHDYALPLPLDKN